MKVALCGAQISFSLAEVEQDERFVDRIKCMTQKQSLEREARAR